MTSDDDMRPDDNALIYILCVVVVVDLWLSWIEKSNTRESKWPGNFVRENFIFLVFRINLLVANGAELIAAERSVERNFRFFSPSISRGLNLSKVRYRWRSNRVQQTFFFLTSLLLLHPITCQLHVYPMHITMAKNNTKTEERTCLRRRRRWRHVTPLFLQGIGGSIQGAIGLFTPRTTLLKLKKLDVRLRCRPCSIRRVEFLLGKETRQNGSNGFSE